MNWKTFWQGIVGGSKEVKAEWNKDRANNNWYLVALISAAAALGVLLAFAIANGYL